MRPQIGVKNRISFKGLNNSSERPMQETIHVEGKSRAPKIRNVNLWRPSHRLTPLLVLIEKVNKIHHTRVSMDRRIARGVAVGFIVMFWLVVVLLDNVSGNVNILPQ